MPTFGAPRWAVQTVIFIILIGFPISLILAWAYELTPEGIKTASPEGPDQYHTRITGQRLNYFILGVLVLAVGFLLIDNYVLVDKGERHTASSVTGPVTYVNTDGIDTAYEQPVLEPPVASNSGKVRRSYLTLGQTEGIPPTGVSAFVALSLDGEHLVYVENEAGTPHLYRRQLNQLKVEIIPDAFNPRILCFSPDGKWVGFTYTGGGLAKVSLLGGTRQELVNPMDTLLGCYWGKDNVIYFSKNNKLHRIPAGGGEPEAVNITSEYSEWNQSWPYALPDGNHLLLTVTRSNANAGHIALLSLETGKTQILIHNAYNARYLPAGEIVFMRSGSLWAVPFDVEQLKTAGPEVTVIDGVETQINTGIAGYTVSDDGLLVYLPGDEITETQESSPNLVLVWVDRDGNETGLEIPQTITNISAPKLSPDDKQLALGIQGQSGSDIWVYNFQRGTFSVRTFVGNAYFPIWTPDGRHLVYYDRSGNHLGISWTRVDGSGQPEHLIEASKKDNFAPYSFNPDGSQLLITNLNTLGEVDIHVLSMTGDRAQRPLLKTAFVETNPSISPDGHWLAYSSNGTGIYEVYVRPFPDVNNGRWQISTGGGIEPHWRDDGKELYYALGEYGGKIKGVAAVAIDTKSGFQPGKPKVLFTGDFSTGLARSYDVTADGQRFIMLKRDTTGGGDLTNLVIVDNWFTELKRLAPPAK